MEEVYAANMDGTDGLVEQMRGWLANKCKTTPRLLHLEKESAVKFKTVIVTPHNIPEFIIPPKSPSTKSIDSGTKTDDEAEVTDDVNLKRYSMTSLSNLAHRGHQQSCSPTSHRRSSPSLLLPKQEYHSRSEPTSPSRKVSAAVSRHDSGTYSCEDLSTKNKTTNVDPMSKAAMSLPHFAAKTSFGFGTLNQPPHTRRKESLFHAAPNSPPPPMNLGSKSKLHLEQVAEQLITIQDVDGNVRQVSHRRRQVASVVAPLGVLPPHSKGSDSPSGSPILLSPASSNNSPEPSPRPMGTERNNSEPVYLSTKCRMYYRRRSSLPVPHYNGAGVISDDSSDDGSRGRSPELQRSSCDNLAASVGGGLPPARLYKSRDECSIKRTPTPWYDPQDHHSISYQDLSNHSENSRRIALYGEVKFALEYLANIQQLKVILIKAENLGGTLLPQTSINSFVKLSLIPGKLQKQVSRVVKNTRNPLLNQVFYFKDIEPEDLDNFNVRMKFFHRNHNNRRVQYLGEITESLETLTEVQEHRLWKNLQNKKAQHQELGYLKFAACFSAREQKLKVTVLKCCDLRRQHLTGAPDPYIKLQLIQPGKVVTKRQTKTKRCTLNPTFNEQFCFDMSPRIDDLNYTALSLTVYNHGRLRSDDCIGQVRLGVGATETSEFSHWNVVLQQPGKEFVEWHTLMDKIVE